MSFEDGQFIFRCFECKKNSEKDFNKNLIDRSANTYRFCNKDISKFILLFRKGVYTYEYVDSWEKFNETTLSSKKAFYSELNLEDVTDKDCAHAQKIFEEFELKNLGDYHDLYLQSDTLFADVFENFRNKCIEIYELDPAHFLVCIWFSMASLFKKG